MTASNREAAISKTLTYEGGYTNDPRDPGGATNWGITIADANAYWKKGATPADVQAMPKSVAIDIYREKYWAVMGCDDRADRPRLRRLRLRRQLGHRTRHQAARRARPQEALPVSTT